MTQTEIDAAVAAQIGEQAMGAPPSNPDIAQALANYAAAAAKTAAALNANLTSNYLTGFQNWSQQVTTGKIPDANPPQPPAGLASSLGLAPPLKSVWYQPLPLS